MPMTRASRWLLIGNLVAATVFLAATVFALSLAARAHFERQFYEPAPQAVEALVNRTVDGPLQSALWQCIRDAQGLAWKVTPVRAHGFLLIAGVPLAAILMFSLNALVIYLVSVRRGANPALQGTHDEAARP